MLLTVKERLLMLALLPTENDVLTMRIVKGLKLELGMREEDFKEFEIVSNPNGSVSWNGEKDKGVEKEVGAKGRELILAGLKDLDSKKKITEDHIALWDRMSEEEKAAEKQ